MIDPLEDYCPVTREFRRLHPLILASGLALAGIGSAAADTTLTSDVTYSGAKYVGGNFDGAGYSITVKASGSTSAKFEVSSGTFTSIKNFTMSNDGKSFLNINNAEKFEVTEKITAHLIQIGATYNETAAHVTTKDVQADTLSILTNGSSFNASGDVVVTGFANSGSSAIHNLTASQFSNNKGAVLTITGKLSLIKTDKSNFSNSGTLHLNAGRFEFDDFDITNSGTIKKSESESLDAFSVKSLRNHGSIAANSIQTTGLLYNGNDTSSGSLSANELHVGGEFINYKTSTLAVEDVAQFRSLHNYGKATVGKLSASGNITNTGVLTITKSLESSGTYITNGKNAVLDFKDGASIQSNVSAELTNRGTIYAGSGALDLQGMTLRLEAGSSILTGSPLQSAEKKALTSLKAATLKNQTNFAAQSTTVTRNLFNDAGGSINTETLSIGGSLSNSGKSSIAVSGSTEINGDFSNDDSSTAQFGSLSVSNTINNQSGDITVKGEVSAEWIDQAGGTFKAAAATAHRLLIENDADLDVSALVLRDGGDGSTGWLQQYSTKDVSIGSLSGRKIRAAYKSTSGILKINAVEEGTSATFFIPDTAPGRVVVGRNDGDLTISASGDLTDKIDPNDLVGGLQEMADTLKIGDGTKVVKVLNFPRRMTLRQDATKKSSIFTRFHLQSPRFFVKIESNSYSQ